MTIKQTPYGFAVYSFGIVLRTFPTLATAEAFVASIEP